jgi:hypothetical protein
VDVSTSGDTLNVVAGFAQYQWYLNGIAIQGATSYSYIPQESGLYRCFVYSANGCKYESAGVTWVVSHANEPVSLLKFTLYPNPAMQTILMTMVLDKPEHFEFSLTDVQERVIFKQTQDAQTFTKTLELNALPAGTYLLHVRLEEGNFVRKIVKQ